MIVGAGLAGLIAAQAFPTHELYEAAPEPTQMHNALLRFRTPDVGALTGIEFRPVTVHKGIWFEDALQAPSITAANLYSQKVLGTVSARSIWNCDSVTRYIAPEDFYERLVSAVKGRVNWNQVVDLKASSKDANRDPRFGLISTIPLHVAVAAFDMQDLELEFHRASVHVRRYKVPNCDVHQTIYFPEPDTALYRASITGDVLICEFANENYEGSDSWAGMVRAAFGLEAFVSQLEPLGAVDQKYGKIAPVDEYARRVAIARLTSEHGIFSLGRFATWRNILLDDVVNDITVIKRLTTASAYERRLASL